MFHAYNFHEIACLFLYKLFHNLVDLFNNANGIPPCYALLLLADDKTKSFTYSLCVIFRHYLKIALVQMKE